MLRGKPVGFLIMLLSIPAMVIYILGVVYYTQIFLDLTAIVAVIGVLSLLTWIGYTMFTEPPPPNPSSIDALDDLAAETIQPENSRHDDPISGTSRFSVVVDSVVGKGTTIRDHVNLYKCKIGRNCKIESFVYIEEGVVIGDFCKIKRTFSFRRVLQLRTKYLSVLMSLLRMINILT